MTDCLSPTQLRQYLAGELSSEEESALSAHLVQCQSCRAQADGYVAADPADEFRTALDDLRSSTSRPAILDETLDDLRQLPTGSAGPQQASPADGEAPETIGAYRVISLLGQGATGSVYLASPISVEATPDQVLPESEVPQLRNDGNASGDSASELKQLVAIKLLDAACVRSPLHRRRFERERDALTNIPSHRNVVRVLDSSMTRERCYLVMEYAGGSSLHDRWLAGNSLTIEEASRFILQAAAGLQHLHCHGLIHRDIKPSNLIVDDDGLLRIVDFGIVHQAEVENFGSRLTAPNTLIGTVDFMAPEQAMAVRDVDHRSDIYSLGCTFAWLLTGRRVYESSKAAEVLSAHNSAPIPSLRDRRPEIPQALDELFQRMIAKRLEDRPDSMSEIIAAIERHLGAPESSDTQTKDDVAMTSRISRIVIAVCTLLVAAVLATFAWWSFD